MNESDCTMSEIDRKHLTEFIAEASERLSLRTILLEQNLAIAGKWPDDAFFAKKDSTLKKNTAFVKKVRNFLDSQKDALLSEFESLNLSKYVEEVATAIVEAKIKLTDIPFMLRLCSAMYQRYSDFGILFFDAWKKSFSSHKDLKNTNLSKLRVDLALFADLNTIGIFREADSIRLLAGQLTLLAANDHDNFTNIGILCSFCRHCSDDWIGVIPRRIRLLSEKYEMEVPRSVFMSSERQSKCRALLNDYLTAAMRRLQNMVKETQRIISGNKDQLESRGEVSEERQERAEHLLSACRKFHESLSTLADLLDADPPLDFSSMIKDESTSDFVTTDSVEKVVQEQIDLFEDEDTRLFYESLPDIKAMVPAILYKESEQASVDLNQLKSEDGDAVGNEDIDIDTVESELATEEALIKVSDDSNESTNCASMQDKLKPYILNTDDVEEDANPSGKVLMETFLTQLPNCINRDLIDRAAIDFCLNLNKRANRRRLAKALFNVPRTRYDLLPFYSRFIAALAPVMPDLVQDINSMLTSEFRWRLSKRDQLNIESKLKVVRFIGELVKFKVYPPHQALTCLKQLLPQFVHHNIDMACALLDTCGRFLYRLPVSHKRTKVYLEVMLRKKVALHMDQRYAIMIENTYYYCNPPPSSRQIVEPVKLTPQMAFIRHILLTKLDRTTVNWVLRLVRKMDWEDKELVEYTCTLFTRAWEIRYTNINCLASVLSGLAAYHVDFTTAVVDNVIEDIRIGMELNLPSLNQRRIVMVKYLGLLYNYCLIDSPVIFKTLYSLLTFGVSLDTNFPSVIDPPDSLFRITLICTLLETSGSFFDRGKKRRKLNIFLIYFQRYYWFKRSLPIWVQLKSDTESLPTKQVEGETKSNQHNNDKTSAEQPTLSNTEDSPMSNNPESSFDSPGLNSDTQILQPVFIPMRFPVEVEQQYFETLQQFRGNVGRAKNFSQAQRLVTHLEARCLPRLARLKATYGLISESDNMESGSQDRDIVSDNRSLRPTGPGHMDTIAEEAEQEDGDIQLDDDEYTMDDDDFDDDDDEDEADEEPPGDEWHLSQRRRPNDVVEPDGSRRRVRADSQQSPEDIDSTLMNGLKTEETKTEEQENDQNHDMRPRFIDCPEDAAFCEALDKMIAEALLSSTTPGSSGITASVTSTINVNADANPVSARATTVVTLPAPDILQLAAAKNRTLIKDTGCSSVSKSNQQAIDHNMSAVHSMSTKSNADNQKANIPDSLSVVCDENNQNTVPFTLISRRGNKPHLVPLAVPDSVQFAARYIKVAAAEKEEKARMKQLVLEMHEAQKEEEMEWGHYGGPDAVLAHQFPVNVNRDRWIKYNHPKGAPDADVVFGTHSQKRCAN
ncbi:Regulator of nonsense transcripts 2 [Schistosoma japonicum]|uniref:Regulator of nonsense transcripts 2 n=1 Tax=Schistosoma japonicum TaxID=6182 RepID=A0A4Z2D256_SCHJA|nr:Regulator of nonsense transcripts 2 [Schistosoma japonicum]